MTGVFGFHYIKKIPLQFVKVGLSQQNFQRKGEITTSSDVTQRSVILYPVMLPLERPKNVATLVSG